jgi:protein TonB
MNTPLYKDREPIRFSGGAESAADGRSGIPGRRKLHRAPGTDLRRDYRLTIQVGLVVSLFAVTALVRAPLTPADEGFDLTLADQETVQMEEILQTAQVEKPPPPPRPPVPVEVPNDEILMDEDLDLDASLDLDEPLFDLPPPPPTPAPDEQEEDLEQEIFVVVEQMPEIIGGTQKVYEYLEYPPIARQAGMEGLVVIQVVVNQDGMPVEPVVARSAGEVLDRAAIEAVMKLRFVPGKQRGKPVRVRMAIPIRFRLRDVQG